MDQENIPQRSISAMAVEPLLKRDTFYPAEEDVVVGLSEESPGAPSRYNFGMAVVFSVLPFVFNASSKVITREIAGTGTPEEYTWMGWTVPAGTKFSFPIFLATVQFMSNAVMSAATYKLTVGGSFLHEMKEAGKVGWLMTLQLTGTKAASSIGAKTGLMGMPLSLYAVARSLGIPCTQLCRVVILKKEANRTLLLSTGLVFFGVATSFWAQIKIAEIAEENDSHAAQISWSFVAVFLIMGVWMTGLHGAFVEKVFDDKNWHPLVSVAYENFVAAFVCILLFPIFGILGLEDGVVVLICFLKSSSLQLLVLALLFCKFWSNMCATYTIYYGDSFQRIALQRPAKIGSQMAIELVAFYGFHNDQIGRPWVNPWSFLIVFSMGLVIVAATFKDKSHKKDKKAKKLNKKLGTCDSIASGATITSQPTVDRTTTSQPTMDSRITTSASLASSVW